MVGGMIAFQRPIPRAAIEAEGKRLGFEHQHLDEFVEIVTEIDDFDIEMDMKRLAAESKKNAAAARRPGNR